jgi:predicted ATPase/class 3 adenylate cyclase/DNA-binding CsgD family transcriptional regulator
MAEPPSGTVTFLLTDIEGSTTLWEEASEAMRVALARHDALFELAVRQRGGVDVKPRGEGDSRFAVFAAAPDAIAAAMAIQRAFAAEPWPTPRPIKVRIGLHTGRAEVRDNDYYGSTVNRCARIRSLGHGGQVLVSEATAALVRDDLSDGMTLHELGEHRLKDLTRPERLFQVVSPELGAELRPLASLDAGTHNLPVQPTSLLGRERDVEEVCARLRNGARLVTLTGPGGTGKTRLGLQVAAELLDAVEHGAYLVLLAPISDPALVASTIAQTIGAPDAGGTPPLDVLKAYLREREMVLLLDNFEQILPAATDVADLLASCPRLTVLVTSRAPLQIGGEHEYPVPPLDLPDRTAAPSVDELARNPAVALFVERASAIKPDFALTETNATAIAQICTRLDGLPLAIELAAARSRLLSPEAMLPRLGSSLALLTGGRRDLPARQRTLRDTIAWSYNLLPEAERRLFWRLGVFAGGFTLEAAEAICDHQADLGIDVLDGIEALAANSLLRRDEGSARAPRFTMLETIRELAVEYLNANAEGQAIRARHLAWCGDLVERGASARPGQSRGEWLDQLEIEHANIRSALNWSLDPSGGLDFGLRLALTLSGTFWPIRGHFHEARRWLSTILARVSSPVAGRATALNRAGYLAVRQSDYAAATPLLEEALVIWRSLGDSVGVATTLQTLATAAHHQRDYDRAWSMFEESLALHRQSHNLAGTEMALLYFADLARDCSRYVESAAAYEEGRAIAEQRGDTHGVAYALRGLGHVARSRGAYPQARTLLHDSLRLLKELRDRRCIPLCLEGIACLAVGPSWAERAARLLGAAHVTQEATGAPAPPADMADYQRTEADARAQLGGDRFRAAWQAGAAMSLDEAVAYALAEDEAPPSDCAQRQDEVPLSAREREVVALIAGGLSNRQIADRLVLSVRTVERHIENVYNRLGISGKAGRAIVTAYALRHGLVPVVA